MLEFTLKTLNIAFAIFLILFMFAGVQVYAVTSFWLFVLLVLVIPVFIAVVLHEEITEHFSWNWSK